MELETIKEWAPIIAIVLSIIGIIVSIIIAVLLAGVPKKWWKWWKQKLELRRWVKGRRAKVANKMKEVGERSLKLAEEVKEEAREIGAEENHDDSWALVFAGDMGAKDMKWKLEAIAWLAQEVGELTADTGKWLAKTKRPKRKDVERRLYKLSYASWATIPLVKMMESAVRANIPSILEMEKVDEEMAKEIKDAAGNIFVNVSAEHREKSVEKVKELLAEAEIGNHVLWQAKKARATRRVSDVLREINKVGREADEIDKEIRAK